MRILKVLHGDDLGGIFTCEIQFIKYWKSQGVAVDAIIVGEGRAVNPYKDVLEHPYLLPSLETLYSGGLFNIVKNLFISSRYPRKHVNPLSFPFSYDAVIYRRASFIHIAGALNRILQVPTYWHMPNSITRLFGKIYFNLYLRKYGIIPVANSFYTKSTLGDVCNHVVYPGYDKSRIIASEKTFRHDFRIPKDAIVFGSASRIDFFKAQDLLIGGLIESGILDKNVYCLIAGGPMDSEYAAQLKEQSSKFKDRFIFLGEIDDLSKFYSSIDIYVNSRRDAEPFGISIVESMGAGLPVISYYKGGPSESIQEGVNGWLIKQPTVNSYKETFELAYNSRSEWKVMGESSRNLSAKFQVGYNAQKFLDIIKSQNLHKSTSL